MDLQGFIVGKKFIVKEVAVLRKGTILSHHIFTCPMPWNVLTKSEKYCASWLSAYHWIAMGRRDDPVQHGETPDYNGCNWCGRR